MKSIMKNRVAEDESKKKEDNGLKFFEPGVVTSTATADLPALDAFLGKFNFQMVLGHLQEYSPELKKLFINAGSYFAIRFKGTGPVAGLYIRAVAVYTDSKRCMNPVLRCPYHRQAMDDLINIGYAHVDHVVSTNSQTAVYEVDKVSSRHSVAVRLSRAQQTGTSWEQTFMFALMCRNSCYGSSRCPMSMIFTLEYQYQVLGRATVEIQAMNHPRRAKISEEKKKNKEELVKHISL